MANNAELEKSESWAKRAKGALDGRWTIAIDQEYTFWSLAAESLMEENTTSAKRGERSGYTGNIPCFFKESRAISIRMADHEKYHQLQNRVETLSGEIAAARDMFPRPETSAGMRRAGARTVKLALAGENKLGLKFLVTVLIPFDLSCLGLYQYAVQAERMLPADLCGRKVLDWRRDYINYVRRRSRGIFQETRKLSANLTGGEKTSQPACIAGESVL